MTEAGLTSPSARRHIARVVLSRVPECPAPAYSGLSLDRMGVRVPRAQDSATLLSAPFALQGSCR